MQISSRRLASLLLVLLVAVALGACGQDEQAEPASSIGTGAAALSDNAAQADTIIGSGKNAFETRMTALRGHPVVVNQWASWCENCRFEFPFFKAAAGEYSDRVAFLGLDARDDRAAAEAFQKEVTSGFPSVFDADASVAREAGGGTSWPTTFFYSPEGKVVFVKIGAYATQELFERDIRTHALGEGT